MRIQFRRNKKGATTITFRATTKRDGVALRDAVLAAGNEPNVDLNTQIAKELAKQGYDDNIIDRASALLAGSVK